MVLKYIVYIVCKKSRYWMIFCIGCVHFFHLENSSRLVSAPLVGTMARALTAIVLAFLYVCAGAADWSLADKVLKAGIASRVTPGLVAAVVNEQVRKVLQFFPFWT